MRSFLFRFSDYISVVTPLHPVSTTEMRMISVQLDRCATLALTRVTLCLDLTEVCVLNFIACYSKGNAGVRK
jgi:hypothetical protein